MDSYNFHFERMSNVDLHPLSLPVCRLSPAKSNSSIADQLAHHQHGKGDSAYSSFSGGSTAPDYPSPFLPDDLQPGSFSHYADLKYVKSIYHPTQVLQSDSKTMDQLYRSVEAISQQYRNNAGGKVNHHNHSGNDSFHRNNKAPSQGVYPHVRPPPIPARMDSFIATKNLENSRVHRPTAEQPRPHNRLHGHTTPRSETTNLETGPSNFNPEPVYSVWRGSQQQQPQPQHPPSYRTHLKPHDQPRAPQNPDYIFAPANKLSSAEHHVSSSSLSQSPPRGTSQPEQLKPRQASSSGALNGDHHSSSHFEGQRKRALSSVDWIGAEPNQAASPRNTGFINSSIQHKGQFYFVTGVCSKPPESSRRTYSASVCGSEAGSEGSTVLETHQLREKERCHSTMDNLFRPPQDISRSSSGTIPDEREVFTPVSQAKELCSRNQDQENHRLSLISIRSSRSFDAFEDIDITQSRDIGRHTANNPIFYCGPDRGSLTPTNEIASLITSEQPSQQKNRRQPLGDVASERINKETTPLLYHLTGANRAALQPKKNPDFSPKGKETILNKTGLGDASINNNEKNPKSDASKNDRGEFVSACNTLDDSFKKYYKEKLKDAQSKVLRETSFKRRDLQLSWPHRIRQKPELRTLAVHTFSSSQDSETSTETLTPSVASEETERGSIREEEAVESRKEADHETEKENGRPANVAQPQVARFRGRKRLTQDQKKMCYSEPEKLNQLGGAPVHHACRSFGNECDNVFAMDCEVEERVQQGEQGLVAARRKMFETRGRALSASSASKTNLKHLQHKALVEYMERKTGQKVAEPQQPVPQFPPPTRQRHSLGEKPFDWGPRPLSGNCEGLNNNKKKKLHRPHSAGRILDSSTSSIRYAQFFSTQSSSSQHSNQPRWRESHGPAQGKSASVESLLDQPESRSFFRNRSTSTPHALEGLPPLDTETDPLPVNSMETWSGQKSEDSLAKLAAEGQRQVRTVAQRGKSMEELGALRLKIRPSALSKSSEQLDRLGRHSTGAEAPDKDKRSAAFFAEVREAQGQDRGRKGQNQTEQPGKERETAGPKNAQGQMQNQTQRNYLLKQNSEPGEGAVVESGGSASPASSSSPSSSSSRARVHSGPAGLHSAVADASRSGRPPSATPSHPPSPRGPESSETEIRPTSSTPTQPKLPSESRPSSRTTTSVPGSVREEFVDEPVDDAPPTSDSSREVSLSCGVTTDPSLWILPPDEEATEAGRCSTPADDVFDEGSAGFPPPPQASDAAASPRTSISDAGVSQQAEEGKRPETDDDKSGENQAEVEERGAPEEEEEDPEKVPWEELVEAVVRADQSLSRVLYPLANRKTALMLMEQLLSEDTLLMEEHYKKKQEAKEAVESAEVVEGAETPRCPSDPETDKKTQCTEQQSKADITEKKHLLASRIKAQLRSLEEARGALQAEIQENVAHGEALEVLVRERCQPVELERYNLFIGDLERVVSLLLCLSARLARVQNALSTVDQHTDAEEKQSLDSRHRLLCKQRDDAKDLKDNLDRRESLVSGFLSRQLSAEQLQDYRRFVQTKASLLIRQKDLEERQRLGEEQLEALSSSLSQ